MPMLRGLSLAGRFLQASRALLPVGTPGVGAWTGRGVEPADRRGLSFRLVSVARLGTIVAVLAVLGFLVLVGNGLVLARSGEGNAPGQRINYSGGLVQVRERVPVPFTLRLFDGGSFRLEPARGEVVLVNFWASWCAPCRDEAPALAEIDRSYGARGLRLIGVNTWDKEADARRFVEEFGLIYPNGPDPGGVAVEFGVRGIPESYVIDARGRLVRRWIGPLSGEAMPDLIGDLLP
jgi:cytochrome c biogenesis protein CcmG/thiol:disulfide interchange protein DsbE